MPPEVVCFHCGLNLRMFSFYAAVETRLADSITTQKKLTARAADYGATKIRLLDRQRDLTVRRERLACDDTAWAHLFVLSDLPRKCSHNDGGRLSGSLPTIAVTQARAR